MDDNYDGYEDDARTLIRELVHVPQDVAICGLVFGSLCTVSALFGNLLIVVMFLSAKSLRLRQNTFVVSAALMEVAIVLFRDVFLLAVYGVGSWQFGDTMMDVNKTLIVLRNGSAIGHVVAVTLYRYALIVYPNIYRLIDRIPVILMTFASLVGVPLALSSINFRYKTLFNTKGLLVVTEASLGIHNGTLDREAIETNLVPAVMYISLNGFLLLACNAHIYFFIKRSASRVSAACGLGGPCSNNVTLSGRCARKEVKFIKIMAIVFGSFLVSYYLIPLLMMADPQWRLSHWVYLPFVLINWFSSSVNWVVYSLTHSGFRDAVKRLVSLRCKANDLGTNRVDTSKTT